MTFKNHLIIIGVMIAVLFVGWQLMMRPAPPPAPIIQTGDDRFIEIVHATYGLNCLDQINTASGTYSNSTDLNQAYANKSRDNIREDNALAAVGEVCNGKDRCEITMTPDKFSFDPMPDCLDKLMEVEYRCFSFDRLWQVTANQGHNFKIDCTVTK